MAMIQSRNQSSHTYDETTIRKIAQEIIERYLPAFRAFCERFSDREGLGPKGSNLSTHSA